MGKKIKMGKKTKMGIISKKIKMGIIYKNSVQVFPRPSIYDGGLPQPNL